MVGENISVIDTGYAVAKEVKRRLGIESLLSSSTDYGNNLFYTSGNPDKVETAINTLWGAQNNVSSLNSD